MARSMKSFAIRLVIQPLALLVVGYTVPGIVVEGVAPAIVAALIFGVINAIVRPLLLLLTLPITVVTLGLFILVINGLCLGLTAYLVQGFSIAGLWPAVLGAVVMSLISWTLNLFVHERPVDRDLNNVIDVKARVVR